MTVGFKWQLGVEETVSTGGREASFTTKEDTSEFRGSMSPASLGSFHRSLFQFTGSCSFPVIALTLTVDWEFNLHYNSAIAE